MARKLGWLVLAVAIAVPACASELGSISGYVKDSSGVPQMGATVSVLGPASGIATVFTDARGHYAAKGLTAGLYEVRVSAPSFLPSLREGVKVHSGASLVVNVTLNTLFEALQLMPARTAVPNDDDDWKWTLRAMANRPILRIFDDGPVIVSRSDADGDRALKGQLVFLAGSDSDGFGGSADMTTAFNLERSIFTSGRVSVDGRLNYGGNGPVPGTVLRASYSHRLPSGAEPQVSLTMRRLAMPDLATHDAAIQALALRVSNSFSLADFIDLDVGSELQSIQFLGHVGALKPFGSAYIHLSPNTVLAYKYAMSIPNTRSEKGFDSAPADLSESGPRMSLVNWNPVLERAHHQEVSLSQRIGRNNIQVALFSDHISDPALVGVGEVSPESGSLLPDVYSGTFNYAGQNLNGNGIRVVYERKLMLGLSAIADYSYGAVVDLGSTSPAFSELRSDMYSVHRHSFAYKMKGTIPYCKTSWIASYKWTSGEALTPVDLFNDGPGQTDPFFNVFLRQPIPWTGFIPGHMDALIDLRNLLAEGYVPVIAQDGHTVYLVQSARTVRGGVAFTF